MPSIDKLLLHISIFITKSQCLERGCVFPHSADTLDVVLSPASGETGILDSWNHRAERDKNKTP